ncbi:MAG TPA: endonuclease III [Candidatus Polarisedimenticolia bacterium]|nr:endonuclease III [Candidatus Polarisedimenticolia bacterium]
MPGRIDLPRRVGRALDSLETAYGKPRLERVYPPLDELILTILSQNTNDRNRDRAYEALRRRFPTWEEAMVADREALEETIRVGGLARTKSGVIQSVLHGVLREEGVLSLDRLKSVPVQEARRYLAGFKGVGEKTICCVLLFACGHPAFPVDTHIHRVTKRLGWVPATATPAATHARMASLVPPGRYLTAHINLITLGRRVCRARAPSCPVCPVRRACRYALRRRGGFRRPVAQGRRLRRPGA